MNPKKPRPRKFQWDAGSDFNQNPPKIMSHHPLCVSAVELQYILCVPIKTDCFYSMAPQLGDHLEVEVQPLLSEVHGLQQLLVLAGWVDVLLLHHSAHVFLVLVSDGLEPVQGVKLQVLVQQLQDVRHTWQEIQTSQSVRPQWCFLKGIYASMSTYPSIADRQRYRFDI